MNFRYFHGTYFMELFMLLKYKKNHYNNMLFMKFDQRFKSISGDVVQAWHIFGQLFVIYLDIFQTVEIWFEAFVYKVSQRDVKQIDRDIASTTAVRKWFLHVWTLHMVLCSLLIWCLYYNFFVLYPPKMFSVQARQLTTLQHFIAYLAS